MKRVLTSAIATLTLALPLFAHAGGSSFFNSQGGVFEDTYVPGLSSFNDSFVFTVSGAPVSAQINVLATSFFTFSITNLTLQLYGGGGTVAGSSTSSTPAPFTYEISDSFADLSPGKYALDVAGNTGILGGAYSGTVAFASPVPELSTWLAMGLGLACMTYFLSRRRLAGF